MRKADLRANLLSDDAVFASAAPAGGRANKHVGMPIKAFGGYSGGRPVPNAANAARGAINVNGGGMAGGMTGGMPGGMPGASTGQVPVAVPGRRRPPVPTQPAYQAYPNYATSPGAPAIPPQPIQPPGQQPPGQQPYYGAQQPRYAPQAAYGQYQGYQGKPVSYQTKPMDYHAQQAPPLPPYPQQQSQPGQMPAGHISVPPVNPYLTGRPGGYLEQGEIPESRHQVENPPGNAYGYPDAHGEYNGEWKGGPDDRYSGKSGPDEHYGQKSCPDEHYGQKSGPDEHYGAKKNPHRPTYDERKTSSSSRRRYVSPEGRSRGERGRYEKEKKYDKDDEDYEKNYREHRNPRHDVPSSPSISDGYSVSSSSSTDTNPFDSPRHRKSDGPTDMPGRNTLRVASHRRKLSSRHSSESLSPDDSPDKASMLSNSTLEQDRINQLEDKVQRLERALRAQKSGSESDVSVGSATRRNAGSSNSLIPSEEYEKGEYDKGEYDKAADNDFEYGEIEAPGSLTYSKSIYRTGFEKAGYNFGNSSGMRSRSGRSRKGPQPRMPEINEHLSKPARNITEQTMSSSVYSDRKPSATKEYAGDEDDEDDAERYFNAYEHKYEHRQQKAKHKDGESGRSRHQKSERHNRAKYEEEEEEDKYEEEGDDKYEEEGDGKYEEEGDDMYDEKYDDEYNNEKEYDRYDDRYDDKYNDRHDRRDDSSRRKPSASRRPREAVRTHTKNSLYGEERKPRKNTEEYRPEWYSRSKTSNSTPSSATPKTHKPNPKPNPNLSAPRSRTRDRRPSPVPKPVPVYKTSRSDPRVDQKRAQPYTTRSSSGTESRETRFSPMIKSVPVIKYSTATSAKTFSGGVVKPILPSQSREPLESVVARFRNTRQKALHDYKMFTPKIQFFWAVTLLETVARPDVLSKMAIDGNLRRRPIPAKSLRTQRKQFVSTAVKVLEKLVQTSPMETRARLYLADLYSGGIHPGVLDKNEKAGFSMFYDAATKQKDPVAAYRVACCLEAGVGCRQDSQQSSHFFKEAAMMGDPSAMCQLGMMYFAGANGFPVDIGKSILWHKNAVDRLYDREVMAYDTLISARSFSDARGALYTLAKIYQTDLDLLSINNESQRSRNVIGSLERLDAFRNKQKSLAYYLEAAKIGHPESQAVLGYYYSKGFLPTSNFKPDKRSSNGVKDQIEPKRSIYWYSKAAQHNHAYAALGLAKWYGSGAPDKSLEKDEQQAFLWGRKAADEGKLPEAEFMIGLCFEQGFGTSVNCQMSMNYYKRSASKGYGRAISKVGLKG